MSSPDRGAAATTGPSVAFVIPVRNDAIRLRRCLESIAKNRYEPLEVIVVDNGSTDGSATVAQALGARVIHQPSGRVAQLRNLGVSATSAEIVGFVDADHEIASDWLQQAASSLANPRVGATGTLCHPPADGTWVQHTYDLLRAHPAETQEVHWLGAGNLAVRRSVFAQVGGFDGRLEACEDVDLCQRIRAERYQILDNPRLHNIHFGDPRGLRELYRSELWRGRDNLRVSLRSISSLRDIPSVAIPIVDLLLLVTAAVGPMLLGVQRLWFPGTALGIVVGLSGMRALRMVGRMRRPTLLGATRALAVALVYDVARAFALVLQVSHRRAAGVTSGAAPVTTVAARRSRQPLDKS